MVGQVGSTKHVHREKGLSIWQSFWNFLGCLYLERHNFEILASNKIDGGVFVVSGRTSIIRTSIIQDEAFVNGFVNDKFFFGKFDLPNADDDNFITRWMVNHGWNIKIQSGSAATIETTLGQYPKFLSQCLRWSRKTWRSNTASLITERTVYQRQPWCVYAVYLTDLINFALIWDPAMLLTLWLAVRGHPVCTKVMLGLGACILASKMVKPLPHFIRHPKNLLFFPFYVLFGYYHSLIKLRAGLTFYVTVWAGR
jgi:hypothetical protein